MEKTFEQRLLEVQKEIGAIKRDSTNPFFKSNYFDINALLREVKPILNKYGLVLTQPLTKLDGKLALETRITDSTDGKSLFETCPLPEVSDPQKAGSAITYFRRYALQSLLALEATDDDANDASQSPQNAPERTIATKTNYGKSNFNPATMKGKPASDKQKKYALSLAEEKGVELNYDDVDAMDGFQISQKIDELMNMKLRMDDDTQYGEEN